MKKVLVKRLIKYTTIAALLMVFGYITMLTVQVVSGVSRTEELPDHSIRLRVLDAGCSDIRSVVDSIKTYSGADLDIVVVGTEKFNVRDLAYSFIISHDEDKTEATMLARRLRLDASAVIYKPLDHNQNQITATLVAGLDMNRLVSTLTTAKEK